MIQLRNYQIEAVNSVFNELLVKDTSLLVLPTGCGKTEIMFELCSRLNGKILIASHKVNLVEQTARRALKAGKKVGVFCNSLNKSELADITIASVQSISSINHAVFDYLIIDEAHKLPPKNKDSAYKKLIDALKLNNHNLKIIAVTATPYRINGYIYGEKDSWFSGVSYSKPMKEMIESGYLVKPRLKQTESEFNVRDLRIIAGEYAKADLDQLVSDVALVKKQIEDAIKRLDGRKKVAWACTSIKHAQLVQSLLPESVIIHSQLSTIDAARNMSEFEKGSARNIVFVTMLSEGYDHPPIDALVFMRPTRSPTLYVQTVGRTLRPSPGKADALILDYGQVVKSLGPVDNPIINISQQSGKKRSTVSTGKFCQACLDYNELKATECSGCGTPFPVKRDPFKSLTNTHSGDGEILSGDGGRNWISVMNVVMAPKISNSGRSMIEVSYYPHGKVFPFREYLTFGNTQQEGWMTQKAISKLKNFGIHVRTYAEAVRALSQRTKKVTAIRIKMNGKWPEVVDSIYEPIKSA